MIPVLTLLSLEDMEELDRRSFSPSGMVLFKHSPRCSVSLWSKRSLERHPSPFDLAYVDVVQQRSISLEAESRYGIRHESPQFVWIKNGEAIASASHEEAVAETLTTWFKTLQ